MWSDAARQAAAEARNGGDKSAASTMAQNHSKSYAAPAHDGMIGAQTLQDRDSEQKRLFGVGSRILKKRTD